MDRSSAFRTNPEMQILEASIFGLRAAKITYQNRETGVIVTLFPMIHAAEASFYAKVFRSAFEEHDIGLTEGISSPVATRLTRSYRWMVRQGGQLVLQANAMPETGRARRIHADLSAGEFDRLWSEVPFLSRMTMTFGAPLIGLALFVKPDLKKLARRLEMDDLTSRDHILGWSPETAALDHALLAARDTRLVETLTETIQAAESGTRIAVIYGAAHIPSVLRTLPGLGFAWKDSDWNVVFHT